MLLTAWLKSWKSRSSRSRRRVSCGHQSERTVDVAKPSWNRHVEQLEDRFLLSALAIQFDYSFDTSNFFDTQAKKDVLEQAPNVFESRFVNDLLAIEPSGSNTWTWTITAPGSGASQPFVNYTVPTDTVVVFVGARDLDGPLGTGGRGNFSASGDTSFLRTIRNRMVGPLNGLFDDPAKDFAPWGGVLTFDTSVNWHFGATTNGLDSDEFDFYSVATHELAHVLGFTQGVPAFNGLISNGAFTGPKAVAEYDAGGNIPLAEGNSHWADSVTEVGQSPLMRSTLPSGERRELTTIDLSALEDIGWKVTSSNEGARFSVGSNPFAVTVSDFNGDGKDDLATANRSSQTVSVLLGDGDGTFQPQVGYSASSTPYFLTSSDLNGDGDDDLVVTNGSSNTVNVLLGNGNGTFQPWQEIVTGVPNSFPRSVVIADFNNDARMDLAIANTNAWEIAVMLGNGDGTFQPHFTFEAEFPETLTLGDFNGDGRTDLAMASGANELGDSVDIALGNGNGTFQTPIEYLTGGRSFSLTTADFNADGRSDLAAAQFDLDRVCVLLGNGDGTFQVGVPFSAGSSPYSAAAADLNGDFRLDLAVTNRDAAKVSVLLGNGDGTFQTPIEFSTEESPSSVAFGDFDRDGRLDLVVANTSSDSVTIILNQWESSYEQGFGITAATAVLAEGSSSVASWTFTIRRMGDTSSAATVDFGVLGSGDHPADATDFGGSFPSGTVTFAAGETSKTISLNASDDTVVENDEGFTVTLLNPSAGATITTATAAGTILNDDHSQAAPTDLALPNGYVLENRPIGALVDYFGTADTDVGDTFTYSLVSGIGAEDNGSFTISGNQLLTNAAFDFETKGIYSIRVRSTDSGGEFVEKAVTVHVLNVNELQPTSTEGGGELDTTLSNDGKLLTNLDSGVSFNEEGRDVVIQPDGKFVVLGKNDSRVSLARYNADGSLDATFDGDGKLILSGDRHASRLALQSDGKLVIVGTELIRLNSDGSFDTTFNSSGIQPAGAGMDVVIQPDGKIVVAGETSQGNSSLFTVTRFNSNGSADSTFGSNGTGRVTTDVNHYGYVAGVALQSDGKIVVAGDHLIPGQSFFSPSIYDWVIVRYNANGSLDSSFDGDGIVVTDVDGGVDEGGDVVVQSDGKIVVAGVTRADWAMARYNADGSLDTTFDGDGKRRLDFGTIVGSVAMTPNGNILVGGFGPGPARPSGADFLVARFHPDGSLDNTFGTNGQARADFGEDSFAYGMALQSDGNIVLAGTTSNGHDYDFAVARFVGSEAAAASSIQAVTVIHPEVILSDSAGGGNWFDKPSISADGRYVVFASRGSNLVPGDNNNRQDVFLRDRVHGTTTRISLGVGGTEANGDSFAPMISADGKYVAFSSQASNLIGSDSNETTDAFVRDLLTGETIRGSEQDHDGQFTGPSYAAAIASTAVGPSVAFINSAADLGEDVGDLFLRDIRLASTTRIASYSAEYQFIENVSLSSDGHRLVFASGTDSDSASNVYLADLASGNGVTVSIVAISAAADGGEANGTSQEPMISADGRFVVFRSDATNLVSGDDNSSGGLFLRDLETQTTTRLTDGSELLDSPSISADGQSVAYRVPGFDSTQYFVLDRQLGTTTPVSVSTAGDLANSDFRAIPVVSADGRYVAFSHSASNLVARDTNGLSDIFVRDRQTQTTELISRRDPALSSATSFGEIEYFEGVSISADGQRVLFSTTARDVTAEGGAPGEFGDFRLYLRDYSDSEPVTTLVRPEGQSSWLSANGQYVVFLSFRSNVVPNDTNEIYDLFRLNVATSAIERVNVGNDEAQANSEPGSINSPPMSADGRYVVFISAANNLVPGDTNGGRDVFVRDLELGTTRRVSVTSSGLQANGDSHRASISANGRFVAFTSDADNLVAGDTNQALDVFLHDLQLGTTIRVSLTDADTQADGSPVVSADGRFVAFESRATNLADGPNERNIFVRDIHLGTTRLVSVQLDNSQSSGISFSPSISDDGRFVAFASTASHLVSGDTNDQTDIFVRDLHRGVTTRVNLNAEGQQANGHSHSPVISGDGTHLVFHSGANNLVPNDLNGADDVFVVALQPSAPPANVDVAVSSNQISEDGTASLVYTFTRDGSTDTELTIAFNVSGAAGFGTDYEQSGAVTFNATSGTVTFAAGSSTATVTIDPTADGRIESDESVTLTVVAGAGYVAGETATASGSITNDDVAGFSITPSTGTLLVSEVGSTAQFAVRLTAQPTSNVVLTLTSSDTTEATVSASTLTFTPSTWDVSQTVTVTGVDDIVVDGAVTSTVTVRINAAASDNAFDAVANKTVSVSTADDDFFGFRILQSAGSTIVSESGSTDTFTIVLAAQPTSNVVLNLTSGDTGEATISPAKLTFTASNWNRPQTVTVKGVNDDFVDGSQISNITIKVNVASSENRFDAFPAQTVSVTNTDNEVAGFRITQTSGSTSVNESGTTDTFTVVLTARPVSNVVLNVSSGRTTEATVSPATVTFTTSNWNVAKTVTVRGVNDDAIDGDQTSVITVQLNDALSDNGFEGVSDQTVTVTTVDNDLSDFGDAPDSYGTALPNGARHLVSTTGPKLGSRWDGETDGQPSSDATADGTDEDGVFFPVDLLRRANQTVASSVFVTASKAAKLDAWIDFNRDGDFLDAGERIATGKSVAIGLNLITFNVPTSATSGDTFARFRISTSGVSGPTGSAPDGEVEDYAVKILEGENSRRLIVDLPAGSPAITVATVDNNLEVKAGTTLITRISRDLVTGLEINGSSGNDKITLGSLPTALSGHVTLNGGAGDDLFNGTSAGVKLRLVGDSDDDTLLGGSADDTLLGGSGDDSLKGNGGDDILLGGSGKDKLFGDAGNDALVGDAGNDSLEGGADKDTLLGLAGDDTLKGGDGNDTVMGGDNDDSVNGGAGTDTLVGGSGNNLFDTSGERNELFSFNINQILDRI